MRQQMLIRSLACVAILAANIASAETRREGGSNNAQLHAMQELTQQNAALEQEKATLAAERDGLKAQLSKFKATHAADEKALTSVKDASTALNGRLTDLLGKHAQLQTEEKSLQEKLQDAERRNKILNGKIADLAHQHASCEENNHKLYQLNVELLGRYRKKGVFDTLLQREPISGLKAVEIENVIQKYRDKNDAQRLPDSTVTRNY